MPSSATELLSVVGGILVRLRAAGSCREPVTTTSEDGASPSSTGPPRNRGMSGVEESGRTKLAMSAVVSGLPTSSKRLVVDTAPRMESAPREGRVVGTVSLMDMTESGRLVAVWQLAAGEELVVGSRGIPDTVKACATLNRPSTEVASETSVSDC